MFWPTIDNFGRAQGGQGRRVAIIWEPVMYEKHSFSKIKGVFEFQRNHPTTSNGSCPVRPVKKQHATKEADFLHVPIFSYTYFR